MEHGRGLPRCELAALAAVTRTDLWGTEMLDMHPDECT